MMTKQVSVIMVTMQCNDNYDDGVGVYDVIDDNGVGATGCESKVSLVSGKCLCSDNDNGGVGVNDADNDDNVARCRDHWS